MGYDILLGEVQDCLRRNITRYNKIDIKKHERSVNRPSFYRIFPKYLGEIGRLGQGVAEIILRR